MSASTFRTRSAEATADGRLTAAIAKTCELLLQKRAAATAALGDFEARRERAKALKRGVTANLPAHIAAFAKAAAASGAKVHYAKDEAEVAGIFTELANRLSLKTAVKAKSMTAEEVELNEIAHRAGVEVTETDLGEFIIQLADEKPSHIMAPAIHRDKAQVAELFAAKIGSDPRLDVEGLVAAARAYLRRRFLTSDLGISGANFAAADTGTVVLVTNEGNGRMATTLPRVHLVLMGAEKIIPRLADAPELLALLTRSASGQGISTYVNFITGPKRPEDSDGPDELHIIILDHGRLKIAKGPFSEILHCLHCGACLNHCPVYRSVGGHAWKSAYPGPMGSVLSPLLWGLEAYPELPDACTLCGRCREACPMGIPLPDYHLALRAAKGVRGPAMAAAGALAANPTLYRLSFAILRKLLAEGFSPPASRYAANWRMARKMPDPKPGKDFRKWWKERK